MKKLLLALVLALPLSALADTVSLSWSNPTTNTNGSAIPATGTGSIASNRIERGSCSGTAFGTSQANYTTLTAVETFTTPDLAPGTYCFRVFAKNTYGNESLASNVVQKIIASPVPNPPNGVVINSAAMQMRKSSAGVWWIVKGVGTIPKDSPCYDADLLKKTDGTYRMVDESLVVWKDGIDPASFPTADVVAALCTK